ncbi:MAG: hypothetical protein WC627_03475 [Legionella sp.]|jgi:hypothetical protein
MARMTISLPDNIHKQVLEIAEKEKDSISFTVTKLVEIGIMLLKNQQEQNKSNELEEYCQKLIIQINGIIKELAIEKFDFNQDKIASITQETLNKFNKLKSV